MAEITFTTKDGQTVKAEYDVMKISRPVEEFYKDNAHSVPMPLANIEKKHLEKIVAFCKQYQTKAIPAIEKPLRPHAKLAEIIRDDWLLKFVEMSLPDSYAMLSTSDYLALNGLKDIIASTIAVRIVGKATEALRKEFEIKNDFTPAEEKEINEWFNWSEELWP